MKLLEKLREALEGRQSRIKVRGETPDGNLAEIRMTHIKGAPIKLGTPVEEVVITIQPLIIKDSLVSMGDNRVDNCHDGLHQHSRDSRIYFEDKTMSGSLMISFGRAYEVLENQQFSI